MANLTIDEGVLRALQQRAEQLARGELGDLGQALSDLPAVEDVRRAIDVLGAHTKQGLQHQHAYIAALSTAQEAERGRLARELHDEVIQQLVALGHSVDRVQRLLERGEPEQAVARLRTMRGSITALVGELRAVIGDLRPPALEELGLLPAVELLLQRGGEGAPEVALLVQGDERRLAPQSELALFRIIQEAWSNIRRHAQASQAQVAFRYEADGLVVTVTDDGVGFAPPDEHGASDGHWGARGMRERAELTGGSIDMVSAPGQGTTLTVRIPYPGVGGRDPVCGMSVGPDALGADHAGELYRFCSPACRDLFLAHPQHYVASA
ncbi:MAG: YHS domain-containing protein [Chloroflexales bacterium]|nr:YHS domain-containing protein [Chloroflexales bacterium]